MSTGARGYRLFSFLFSGHRRLLWRISIITIINTVGYYHTTGRKYTNDILLEYTRISRPLLCYSIVSRGLISACFSIVIIFVYLRPLRLLFSILKFFFFFCLQYYRGTGVAILLYLQHHRDNPRRQPEQWRAQIRNGNWDQSSTRVGGKSVVQDVRWAIRSQEPGEGPITGSLPGTFRPSRISLYFGLKRKRTNKSGLRMDTPRD